MGDTNRREWDKSEYLNKKPQKQKPKQALEDIDKSQLRLLEEREEIDFTAGLGKRKITSNSSSGFFCSACNLGYNDNLGYLEHINSPLHLKTIGLSMRVKRSTVDQVRKRIEERKLNLIKKPKIDPKERIDLLKINHEKLKQQRKLNKRTPTELDEEVAQQLGFGGFGTSKKN